MEETIKEIVTEEEEERGAGRSSLRKSNKNVEQYLYKSPEYQV
jgi:hypothetical protein